jgi:hypothetical protein
MGHSPLTAQLCPLPQEWESARDFIGEPDVDCSALLCDGRL